MQGCEATLLAGVHVRTHLDQSPGDVGVGPGQGGMQGSDAERVPRDVRNIGTLLEQAGDSCTTTEEGRELEGRKAVGGAGIQQVGLGLELLAESVYIAHAGRVERVQCSRNLVF